MTIHKRGNQEYFPTIAMIPVCKTVKVLGVTAFHTGADPDRGESGLSHGQIFPLRIFRGYPF